MGEYVLRTVGRTAAFSVEPDTIRAMQASRGQRPPSPGLAQGLASVRLWSARQWLVALLAGGGAALVIGVPTGIIATSWYARMTPVTWWDYPIWALSSVLVGLTAATYVRSSGIQVSSPDRSRRTLGATLLSALAVGCPVCNKLVVSLVGISGALSYWAPVQPVLGTLSVGLLAVGLAVRLRGAVACPVGLAR